MIDTLWNETPIVVRWDSFLKGDTGGMLAPYSRLPEFFPEAAKPAF